MPISETFQELGEWSQKFGRSAVLKSASASPDSKSVFLSHSSKDHGFLPGVIEVLSNHGGRSYIDDDDENPSDNFYVESAVIPPPP
jgi:hypothetical protein